ncbi:MAG: hypothetical protein ABJL72_12105 [Roseobacter sp.]
MRRTRIENEAALFQAVRSELDRSENNPYFELDASKLHAELRNRLVGNVAWLDNKPEKRVTFIENISDWGRLGLHAGVLLLILSMPGLMFYHLFGLQWYLATVAALFCFITYRIYQMHALQKNEEVTTNFKLIQMLTQQAPGLAAVFIYPILVLLLWAVDILLQIFGFQTSGTWIFVPANFLLPGIGGLFVVLPGIVYWLRRIELNDSSQFDAQIDPQRVTDISEKEDWVNQNHMGSVVYIRPGVLRTLIVRFGHRGLGYFLRATASDGYLGSMRAVHFAHWAFLNNHGWLLFFSNYDQSWGSYLDDFIEKAHVGLTLAWGCGVGFPPTRFLIYDGASRGRLFKNWALASRTVSRCWISAYPDLSVDQIERNYRLADGLRKTSLSRQDAEEWLRDL